MVSHGQIRRPQGREAGLGPRQGKAENPSRQELPGHKPVEFPGIEAVQLGALGFRQGHENDVVALVRSLDKPTGILVDEVDPGVPGQIGRGREEPPGQSHQIGVQFHVSEFRHSAGLENLRSQAGHAASQQQHPPGLGVFQQAELDLVLGRSGDRDR